MKENKLRTKHSGRRALALAGIVAFFALIGALVFAYGRLRDIWEEQCVITDYTSQVSITDGRMVRADVIAGQFGIKNGANLAAIDFERRRREIMEKIPNIRNIRITRHLPNRVEIDVEERVPVAKLGIKGRNDSSGRVVDTDGVVFISSSGTQMLPTIREGTSPGTQKGKKLAGMALSALRLVEMCRERFSELGVIEADASKPDYITIIREDYTKAKIAWNGMEEPSDAMLPSLVDRLDKLSKAISSNVDGSIREWDARREGAVYGNTMREFL